MRHCSIRIPAWVQIKGICCLDNRYRPNCCEFGAPTAFTVASFRPCALPGRCDKNGMPIRLVKRCNPVVHEAGFAEWCGMSSERCRIEGLQKSAMRGVDGILPSGMPESRDVGKVKWFGYGILAGVAGLEPTTGGFGDRCSTN